MATTADESAATNYPTATAFCLTSALWFAGAVSFGMIGAGYLIAPDFMANIGWVHFGKARPIHVNLVLFGFVTPGLLATAFYFIPKLLRTNLFSEKLGVFTAVIWNITLVSAVYGIGAGYSQGREYAELPWSVDIMVVVLFLLVIINVVMTIARRKEPILYVSVWYVTAAVVLTATTYCIGNVIWKPDTGALLGIPDAILLWFYGHNVFGLLLTPMGLGVAYYVLADCDAQSPLQPHLVPDRFLVADHRLYPYRHPPSASGSGADLFESYRHRRQYGHGDSRYGCTHQPLVHRER